MTANITFLDPDESGRQHITLKQGTSIQWAYGLKNGSEIVNTTGYTVACQFRTSFDSPTALLTLTTENGKITNDTAQGLLILNLSPAETSALRIKGESIDGIYDVELTYPNGYVQRLAFGSFVIEREVTR